MNENLLYKKSIIQIDDYSRSEIELILAHSEKMPGKDPFFPQTKFLEGKIIDLAFFEPSTRTRMSFEHAIKYLGGSICDLGDLDKTSLKKGESFEDTIKIISGYCNAIILRSSDEKACIEAKKYSDGVPIINAGNGSDEHPTQALLDLYTIKKKLGRLDCLNVGIIGDLKYGRTVHSLVKSLSIFEGNTCNLLSPKGLELPEKYFTKSCINCEFSDINDLIKDFDVLYATRIQKERLPNEIKDENYSYEINQKMMDNAKKNMILMHPLPRINEITAEVDMDPRAAYFEQAKNGLIVRQALLYSILRKKIIL